MTFGAPPDDFLHQVSGPWMYIVVPQADGAAGVKARWEAQMLAAVYSAEAPSQGVTSETGFSILDPSTPGCAADLQSVQCDAPGTRIAGLGNVLSVGATGPVAFDPTPAPAAALEAQLRTTLATSGLTVRSITFEDPAGYLAPMIFAETADPATFVKGNATATSLFGAEPTGFEGIYLEVDDSAGNPVLIRAFASRLAAGIAWTRPDLNPNPVP